MKIWVLMSRVIRYEWITNLVHKSCPTPIKGCSINVYGLNSEYMPLSRLARTESFSSHQHHKQRSMCDFPNLLASQDPGLAFSFIFKEKAKNRLLHQKIKRPWINHGFSGLIFFMVSIGLNMFPMYINLLLIDRHNSLH